MRERGEARPSDAATAARSWLPTGVALDRGGARTLVEQISRNIENAIADGALPAGSRLPSWRDLAAELGVARGTIKAAYERLGDRGMLAAAGAAGTFVANCPPSFAGTARIGAVDLRPPMIQPASDRRLPFHMGVPSNDAFPATLWARIHRAAVRDAALHTGYSDPLGHPDLRSALASHVAIARGVECVPEQIVVTSGYRAGLALVLQAVQASGRQAWMEEPGYPMTRMALESAGLRPVPVPVDDEGLMVGLGRGLAPDAALAVVTPGQQAPTGAMMSWNRRLELLRWANAAGAWVVEDDYLAELHLDGRIPSALASGPGADRVIHVGTFSKTIAPMVGLGFLVTPLPLAARLIEVATLLGAPPGAAAQLTLTRFLRDGHYLRHLRRMRRLYAGRRRLLTERLHGLGITSARPAGLSVMVTLPDGTDDERLCRLATDAGLGPGPLSRWFADPARARPGLNLGVANVLDRTIDADCARLVALLAG